MRIQLIQLTVALDYSKEDLKLAASGRLGIPVEAVRLCYVTRRSVDARGRHRRVCFSVNVEAEIEDSALVGRQAEWQDQDGVIILPPREDPSVADISEGGGDMPSFSSDDPPVVVGAGPAGLLATWRLARAGARPILIERGAPAEERRTSAASFWSDGVLDPEDNILYGEGGAGLFSDGKLVTRTKMRGHLCTVLQLLVDCGAPQSILIDAEPHVGSDRLGKIVVNLREQLIEMGADIRFHSHLDGLEVEDGRLVGVVVNGETIRTSHCVLATGHSARDVYEMLHHAKIPLLPKAFAVGLRIEVPQKQIDRSQYAQFAGHKRLGAASFRLARKHDSKVRSCYSFCMCPGGSVIACASSAGQLTTNGMSMSDRSGRQGNAGFLVPVSPEDYDTGNGDPLAGMKWQQAIEAKAFAAGGGDFALPACRLTDFVSGRKPTSLPEVRSCKRAVPADLRAILPGFVRDTLVRAIPFLLGKLSDVRANSAIIYGAETRSSSPVRIARDEQLQSPGARGLYPVGEGAGYAGGIVTSAIDGLRAAEAIVSPETQGE